MLLVPHRAIMCGIAGAIGSIDSGIESAVRAMMAAEAHRGPDDNGLFRSEGEHGVVLGFQRLSILDLSPVTSATPPSREKSMFSGLASPCTKVRKRAPERRAIDADLSSP